ncbi:T9SS type A sorting domain-containing protein [Paracnuella aquatica]|uniref:T9SS type A sorting domain-containing protein n=1 Tax=Paracnuella aquatica TaxID=2268757 RepID=UPI000DEF1D65|nr:T9SS type A sorting domain-containing protein [Paracnuella aquatica]RPD45153.1 T9SS C-terminal target domain-containing protein [Paracnuella aquatica]
MKRLLLSILFALVVMTNLMAQCDPNAVTKRWTGTGNSGDLAGPIPISVDGSVVDWQTHIIGSYTAVGTDAYKNYNPYLAPVAPGNVQIDGYDDDVTINNVVGTDLDDPQASSRDLRYFAFTFDKTNIYFYFRRPANGTTQMSFYYFMDINADGYMRTGEPVVRIGITNNSAPTITMCYYQEKSPAAAGSIIGLGDPMTSPSTGLADGYNMPGSVVQVSNQPTVNVGELFNASLLESGYGVEFVVPFSFLKTYTGLTLPTLSYTRVFTWHVSLNNGSGGPTVDASKFEDNAGGCCSGLAVSGDPLTELQTPVSVETLSNPLTQFRIRLAYLEKAGAPTNVALSEVVFTNDVVYGTAPDPTAYIVKVAVDNNNDQIPDGNTYQYVYSSVTNKYIPETDLKTAISSVAPGSTARFLVDVDFVTSGIKSVNVGFANISSLNLNQGACLVQNAPVSNQANILITTVLPVKFTSFTAARNKANKQQVDLTWTTAQEQNNKGFYLQRKTGNEWKDVAFVFSAAEGGNSSEALTYRFKDANTHPGVSQYRLLQVDLDGKATYSNIVSLMGDTPKSSVVIYPNPAVGGNVNLVFADGESAKQVLVSDLSGRVVQQARNITTASHAISGLKTGFYTIKVTNTKTGETVVEKIIVP